MSPVIQRLPPKSRPLRGREADQTPGFPRGSCQVGARGRRIGIGADGASLGSWFRHPTIVRAGQVTGLSEPPSSCWETRCNNAHLAGAAGGELTVPGAW